MKKKVIALAFLCLLSLTACERENVSEQSDVQVTNQEGNEGSEEVIYFGKEETGLLELGDVPVVCEFDSGEKKIEVKYYEPDYEAQMEEAERQLLRPDAQVKIDDVWIRPVEMEYWPGKIYVGNLMDNKEIQTFLFVEHIDELDNWQCTSIYRYDDMEVEEIGRVPGWISLGDIAIESDGVLVSEKCVNNMLQKNYYKGYFFIPEGYLAESEKDWYEVLDWEQQNIMLLEEINVYVEPEIDSRQFEISPQKIYIVECDGVEWVKIQTSDGKKGYVRVSENEMLDMDNRNAGEIFAGLDEFSTEEYVSYYEVLDSEVKVKPEFVELGTELVLSRLSDDEIRVICESGKESEGSYSDLQLEIDKVYFRPIEMKYNPQKAYLGDLYDMGKNKFNTMLFVEHSDKSGEKRKTTVFRIYKQHLEEIQTLDGWISTEEISKDNISDFKLKGNIEKGSEDVVYELNWGQLQEVINVPKDICKSAMELQSQNIQLKTGKKYNCDIVIEVDGEMFVYEFPNIREFNVNQCELIYDYENMKVGKSSCFIPVLVAINGEQYLIGEVSIYFQQSEESSDYTVEEVMYKYSNAGVDYRKEIEDLPVEEAIIRAYNPVDRTVEICFVTLVEYDTSIGYETEKEEWKTIPLAEEVKIIAWLQEYIYITEEVFARDMKPHVEYAGFIPVYVDVENDVIKELSIGYRSK